MAHRVRWTLLGAGLWLLSATAARADTAPFDLAGPILEVTVSRGTTTLPIAEVPNLAAGDQLSIKADLPTTQSEQYLMVAAFLSGATNPPPTNWFFRCKTWSRKCAHDGLTLTVPQDAQQVLVFLAPRTSGDFSTLVDAVQGRPGAFVRASQDLNQATLDRSRLQAYLSGIRALDGADPVRLKEAATLMARSLAIKVNEQCLDRMPELQAPCLMQSDESLILNDGHSVSMVEALTSGPASDLAMEASFTPQLSYGYYSPYIASVFDIGRILASLHTAQYQYIPALASLDGKQLALTLNTPPSFHNPKSVLMTALPAVEHAQPPPLHAVNPKDIYCARKSSWVLPVEGAPLVFSTAFAHDLSLRLIAKGDRIVDLPVRADAQQGGYVVQSAAPDGAGFDDGVRASLRGAWGFDSYDGPSFQLVNSQPQSWQLADTDEEALLVGGARTVHLKAGNVSCLQEVWLRDSTGQEFKTEWKAMSADEVQLTLPLQSARPGALTLLMKQYGVSQPESVALQAFAPAGHLDDFILYAGDAQGVLKGTRLDEVASLILRGVEFVPGALEGGQGADGLPLIAQDSRAAAALKPGDSVKARVTLKDGQVLSLLAHVGPARPRVTLVDKSVRFSASATASHIHIADPNELPQDASLTFSVRTQAPSVFAPEESIEVATVDGSSSTVLSFANRALTWVSPRIAVATLDAAHPLGMSAFGPLQFRVNLNGVRGDWQPLVTLVRLPVLTDLTCPPTPELACKLSGSGLFLVDSISDDPQFTHPVQVPDGFPGDALPVPQPSHGELYVKLRDAPSALHSVAMPVTFLPPAPQEAARDAARLIAATPTDQPVGTAPADASQNPTASAGSPAPELSQAPAPENEPASAAPSQPSAATANPLSAAVAPDAPSSD